MMSVILLVVGILVTGIGVVVVGFGIPINDLAVGQTLIIAGATALVGGPILIGLAAAVSQLAQIAEALKGRPAARPARPLVAAMRPEEHAPEPRAEAPRLGEPRPPEPRAPEPRVPEPRMAEPRMPAPRQSEPAAAEADPTVAVSASAIERLRSTMGRPERPSDVEAVPPSLNGGQHPAEPADERNAVDAAPETVARSAAAETAKEPRLDFLFRSRAARPTQVAPQEAFDTMWPKRGGRGGAEPARAEPIARQMPAEAPMPVEERRAASRPAAPQVADERSVAILKSGVVDGMAYTLYADGSIEAQLPQGTVRFGSIAELRAHIENNS
jgi:hypothetical protein